MTWSENYNRNTCTQQTLAHSSNKSLENPSKNDNFSKLSERNRLYFNWKSECNKKTHRQFGHKLTTIQTGNYFIFKFFIVIFTF